jgi:hypothetical protein
VGTERPVAPDRRGGCDDEARRGLIHRAVP